MIIPRYWVREVVPFPYGGETGEAGCWGWSETSQEEARERSVAAGRRLADWLAAAGNDEDPAPPGFEGWYGYDARPAREEIIEEFQDSAGDVAAVVTRNSYGCLVLNTRDLVFIDADIPFGGRGDGSLVGVIKGLFGFTPTKSGKPATPPEEQLLEQIRAWSAERPGIGMRLYRTAAGYRGLVTNRLIDASTGEADSMLGSLPTDPLYRALCKSQQCYRARLTPKPWRIRLKPPSQRFPFADGKAEDAFRRWTREYDRNAEGFRTCRLVEQLGPDETLPEIAPLVRLHDRLCRVDSDASLA